jgi:hypothetical protein
MPSISSLSISERRASLPSIGAASRSRRPSAMVGLTPAPISMPSSSQELMLVSNGNGAVVHVTRTMAALLGRTVQQVLANNNAHALEQLMIEPFSQLHRTLAASIPQTAPPAHSCRSGLTLLMAEHGPNGRIKPQPFRMSLKRQMHGDEPLHTMCFEKRTLEQVRLCRTLIISAPGINSDAGGSMLCPDTRRKCILPSTMNPKPAAAADAYTHTGPG